MEEAVAHLFAQLSIRSKIIAGFAAVLICTIGLSLFSTQRLDAVNGNAQVSGMTTFQAPASSSVWRRSANGCGRTVDQCCWRRLTR
ncbi:MAG TPA: hypothetical protein VK822_06190 [Acetobacteraceae bacterium]|jgi:hypothetical protein|nr:hypothetical protein [Acetobacteraceae bacterium]